MAFDPNMKFKRAQQGYDPREVDNVLDELQGKIENLERQNHALFDTITRFNEKITQFEEITEALENERRKQSGKRFPSLARAQLAELGALVDAALAN